jgi:hypothetical protein
VAGAAGGAAQENSPTIPAYIAVVTMNVMAFTISTVAFALITATNSVTITFTAANVMVTSETSLASRQDEACEQLPAPPVPLAGSVLRRMDLPITIAAATADVMVNAVVVVAFTATMMIAIPHGQHHGARGCRGVHHQRVHDRHCAVGVGLRGDRAHHHVHRGERDGDQRDIPRLAPASANLLPGLGL